MSGQAVWFSQSPSNAHWPKEPLHGWAPGSYSCTCRDCGMKYMGDKRSFQCYGCAKKFVPPPLPETPEEIRADRDRLAAELDDMRETVEWLKGVPPEEKVREELNAAARLDLRRWQRHRGPGAVGNPTMHYEDFLAFRAREQGRKESQEEIAQLRAELARVRRNHLRRMLHDIPSANQRSQFYAYHHAEAMTTARIIAIDDRLCRFSKAIRAALAQTQDGTTEGRG